jgi:hypothetical protein
MAAEHDDEDAIDRDAMEAEFIAEILRIVGPGADAEDYAVAPETSDALLEIRVQRLREIPSGIGHEELLKRVGPRKAEG